jgi:hypothetical protein
MINDIINEFSTFKLTIIKYTIILKFFLIGQG